MWHIWGRKGSVYRVLVGESDGKRPIRIPRSRREYKIKMDFKNWHGEAWSGFVWLRIGTEVGHL
jgi:hypothetical protein